MELDYRLVLDAFADAVVAANGENRIVYVNGAAERLLAWSAGELVGRPLTDIIPPRLRSTHLSGFARYLVTREPRLLGRPVRVPALRSDGEEVEVELTLAAFQPAGGDLFVASLRDLSERVELERQLTVTRQLRAAAEAAARLSSRLDVEHVLQTVVRTQVEEFEAALARVWLYEPDTHTLRLRASAGISDAVETSDRALIDVASYPYKVGVIARTRRPFVKNGLEGDPEFEQEWVRREELAGVAGYPLLAGGELKGVLIHFSRHPLAPETVEVLGAFAAIAATSIHDVQLFEREQRARQEATDQREAAAQQAEHLALVNEELESQQEELSQAHEELQVTNEELAATNEELRRIHEELREEQRRTHFLAEAGLVLASSLDYRTTLESLARLAVPEIADWCAVDMVAPDGSLSRLAVAHVDPARVEQVREIERRYPPRPDAPFGVPNVVRTGKAELYPEITEELLARSAQDADHVALIRSLGLVSALCVPLHGHGEVLGAITLVAAESRRTYGADDLEFAQELARRAALAVDHALLHEELVRSARQKDEFLAMLAHELRNPLAAIANAGYMLSRLPLPAQGTRLGQVVSRQAGHLSRLVDDLLDVARITRGSIELRRELIDLSTAVDRAVEAARPLIEERRHHLTIHLPREPVRLLADATRVEQILVNLLHNAAKYTDEGGRIQLTAAREGDEAVLSVRDTGTGIPADLLPRIFNLFTQGDQPLARASGGLGIGLTLVRRLTELHGGSVAAASDGPGKGSEFTVRLPALREGYPRQSSPGDEEAGPPPRRILVVEDSEDAAETLADLLRLWGHEVRVARDGRLGVEVAREFSPEVVLCDLGLPGMNGYQVAEELVRAPETAGACLVALSGYGSAEDRQRSRDAGFDLHLVKPVDPAELRRLLVLDREGARHGPDSEP
jgi:PAS domain S-box-containing protein